MNKKTIRAELLVATAIVFCLPVGRAVAADPLDAVGNAVEKAALPKVKIVLVGGSTATDYAGWGGGFAQCLKSKAQCVNCAQSGRSSKSYANEGWWQKALAEKPDYMLIQFGNNDQPDKGPERATDPSTTYPENLRKYVDEARAAGIQPILVTSLTRRTFGADGKIQSSVTPYVEAMKRVAAEKKVPLIDLHALSIELHEKLGPEESKKFNRTKPGDKEEHMDKTHLSPEGAKIIGRIVADELKKAAPPVAPYIE
jgi:pectinesterase